MMMIPGLTPGLSSLCCAMDDVYAASVRSYQKKEWEGGTICNLRGTKDLDVDIVLPWCKTLELLDLSCCNLTREKVLKLLEATSTSKTLKGLCLSDNDIGAQDDEFCIALANAFHNASSSDTRLDLRTNRPHECWLHALVRTRALGSVRLYDEWIEINKLRGSPTKINLNGAQPVEVGLVLSLAEKSSVRELALDCEISDNYVHMLSGIMQNITSLVLGEKSSQNICDMVMSALPNAKNLRRLVLQGVSFSDSLIQALVELIRGGQLNYLCVQDHSKLRDEIKTEEARAKVDWLTSLSAFEQDPNSDDMSTEQAIKLLEATCDSALIELDLRNNMRLNFEDDALCEAVRQLFKNSQSPHTTLCVNEAGEKFFQTASEAQWLQVLFMNQSQLPLARRATEISLTDQTFTSAVWEFVLASVAQSTNLQTLTLRNCKVQKTRSAVRNAEEIIGRHPTLHTVDFTGSRDCIRPEELLNAVKANQNLVSVSFPERVYPGTTDVAILQACNNNHLKELHFSSIPLGFVAVHEFLSTNTTLESLSIGFLGMEVRSGFSRKSRFEEFQWNLAKAEQIVEALRKHPKLRKFNVSNEFTSLVDILVARYFASVIPQTNLEQFGFDGIQYDLNALKQGLVPLNLRKRAHHFVFIAACLPAVSDSEEKETPSELKITKDKVQGFGEEQDLESRMKKLSISEFHKIMARDLIETQLLIQDSVIDKSESILKYFLDKLEPQEADHKKLVFLLAKKGYFDLKDANGRTFLSIAKKAVNDAVHEITLFCGRFDPTSVHFPEHKSATCVVYRAKDVRTGHEVVLKLMKNEEQYRREVSERKDLDDTCVVGLLACSEEYQTRWLADTTRMFGFSDYAWGIVMPAAQRNLMNILVQERGSFSTTQKTMKAIVTCTKGMHQQNRIHADIKPNNVVRMPNGEIRLIDLDATVEIGSPVGAKLSTAYCPPELTFQTTDTTGEEIVNWRVPVWDPVSEKLVKNPEQDYELVPASVTFDFWGIGAILYRALAHKPLFEADDSDNLRGQREALNLAQWNAVSLADAAMHVASALREENVKHIEELAAVDLLTWLLHPDPTCRPASCDAILSHAFFQENGMWCMSALQLQCALGDTSAVKTLLENKQAANSTSIVSASPLHLASQEGNVEVVELLLNDPDTKPDMQDSTGRSALQNLLYHLNTPFTTKLTARQIAVVKLLCPRSTLDLPTKEEYSRTTLTIGRSSRNKQVRHLFESEMVLQLILGALKSRNLDKVSKVDFDTLWNSNNKAARSQLKRALFDMLFSWGFEPCRSEEEAKQSSKKHGLIRRHILPLSIWQTENNFEELQQLAKQKQDIILAKMYAIRDNMLNEEAEHSQVIMHCNSCNNVPPSKFSTVAEVLLSGSPIDSPLARNKLDKDILVPYLQYISEHNYGTFRSTLLQALNSPPTDHNNLPADWSIWASVAPVKGGDRMKVKVEEYRTEAEEGKSGAAWPYVSCLGDALRAMVVCRDAAAIRFVWEMLDKTFEISKNGRVKNNFISAGKPGGRQQPPDMLMNAVFVSNRGLPQLVEIQIHHHEILNLKENDLHILYEILRAKPADFLSK